MRSGGIDPEHVILSGNCGGNTWERSFARLWLLWPRFTTSWNSWLPSKTSSTSIPWPLCWKEKALYLLLIVLLKSRCTISFTSVCQMWQQQGSVFCERSSFLCLQMQWEANDPGCCFYSYFVGFLFSSSVASAPHLSCVDTSWNTTSQSVIAHINCQVMLCLLWVLVFPWRFSQVLFQDKCIVGAWEENIFS